MYFVLCCVGNKLYLILSYLIKFGESQSRLYPHMRAKFGRGPTAVSKKVSFKCISTATPMQTSFGLSYFRRCF